MKFVGVYLSLMILLMATVGLSFLTLGLWSLPMTLLIACMKGFLILYFFMKLGQSSGSLRLVALASLLWVFFLFSLTAADYLTRDMIGILGK